MEVIYGGANGTQGHPELGDQGQTAVPDFGKSSEVKLKRAKSISAFANSWVKNYMVYRCRNVQVAGNMAYLMETACNNPYIGYNQGSRLDVFKNGVDTQIPSGADCSSLVGFCIAQSLGSSDTSWAHHTNLCNKMLGSGMFDCIGLVAQFTDAAPPRAGDVLFASDGSHVEMVVSVGGAGGYGDGLIGGLLPGAQAQTGFVPRFTAPSPTEANYATYYSIQHCENANTSYAWSRFSEIMKQLCKLSRGPAEKWYLYSEDGYNRGNSPNLGAVMCFTSRSGYGGAVCIVESVTSSKLVVSMVGPNDSTFRTPEVTKQNSEWKLNASGETSDYFFQGFIYNPAVAATGKSGKSKLSQFIETAKTYIGDNGAFVKSKGYDTSKPWSAAFIMAVAKHVGGILDVVIPETTSCSSIGSEGVSEGMGRWLNGPANGGHPYPRPGDIVLLRYEMKEGSTRYDADKAGIVILVDPVSKGTGTTTSFSYVVGYSAGKVESKTADTNTSFVSGLYRPDWDKVDGLGGSAEQGYTLGGYYAQGTSATDAIIKDYKYVYASKSDSEPSINPNGLMLCAINHSVLNGSIYNMFANMLAKNAFISTSFNPAMSEIEFEMLDPEVAASIDGLTGSIQMGNGTCSLNSTNKAIYKYLYSLFSSNGAGAIGFMANMWAESGFRTDAYNASGASGLCQWLAGRKTGMADHCISFNGLQWPNNLWGQLDWLRIELAGSYANSFDYCSRCSWNLVGAKQAADFVCRYFEVPTVQKKGEDKATYEARMNSICQTRQGYAEKLWILFFGGQFEIE